MHFPSKIINPPLLSTVTKSHSKTHVKQKQKNGRKKGKHTYDKIKTWTGHKHRKEILQ